MTVEHIEIDKIDKTQPVEIAVAEVKSYLHALSISVCEYTFRNTFFIKYVGDFSDCYNIFADTRNRIKQRGRRRVYRKIMTVCGSCKRTGFAYKRAGDNSSDAVFSCQNLSCDTTVFIKFFGRHKIFVRGYLKNAVRRRVYDKSPRFKMLFTVILYDFRSRIRFVTQNFPAGLF